MRLPLRAIPANMPVRILQSRLRGMKWRAGSSNHGCWLGSYEYEKRVLFERSVPEGGIVFDIGANVGFYTLLASILVGKRGEVVAFEPLPRNLRYLKSHLLMNRITNVSVVKAAVSDRDGECCFEEGLTHSTGSISAAGALRVRTVVLDSLVSAGTVPVPTHIKIDVEGAEFSVLRGSMSVLTAHKPVLFLATHGKDVHHRCCDLLRSLGYSLRSITGVPVDQTDEILACARR